MKDSEEYLYCLSCKEEIISFQKLTRQQLFVTASQDLNKDIDNVAHSIFPSNSLKSLLTNINEFNENRNYNLEDDTPILNCNYVDIDSFKHTYNNKTFSMFHLNITSLSKHKDVNRN